MEPNAVFTCQNDRNVRLPFRAVFIVIIMIIIMMIIIMIITIVSRSTAERAPPTSPSTEILPSGSRSIRTA